jgi:hypothetical protein
MVGAPGPNGGCSLRSAGRRSPLIPEEPVSCCLRRCLPRTAYAPGVTKARATIMPATGETFFEEQSDGNADDRWHASQE